MLLEGKADCAADSAQPLGDWFLLELDDAGLAQAKRLPAPLTPELCCKDSLIHNRPPYHPLPPSLPLVTPLPSDPGPPTRGMSLGRDA